MKGAQNFVKERSFTHKKVTYQSVVLRDSDDPFSLVIRVVSGGVPVPIKMPGGAPAVVEYRVSFETEFDVSMIEGVSALDWLLREAQRQVEESY